MTLRLIPIRRSLRGRFAFVLIDRNGEGCPIEWHVRAWRPSIYRPLVQS